MAAPEDDGRDDPAVGFDAQARAMDEAPVGVTITDPDRPDNPIVYVNDAFERITGYPAAEILGRNCRFLQGPETDPDAVAELRRAIDAAEPVSVVLRNYRRDGTPFWNQVKVAPVTDDAGEVTHYVGFQMDVTARERAERALARERESLRHVLERVDGLLNDVTQAVVGSEDRATVERRVCERVAATDPYTFAWIGEANLVGDAVEPTAWSGQGDVEAADLHVDPADDGPVGRAMETGACQVATEGVPPLAVGDRAPVVEAVDAVAVVPLVYRGRSYGVLAVASPDSDVFDERELAVLAALGRTIGTAIHAHESKRLLATSDVVDLEFEVRDPSLFFVALSARRDCTLEYQGSVYREGQPLVFFTAEGPPDRVVDEAASLSAVESASVVGDSESPLVEFRLSEPSVVTELADRGARVRAITAEDGVARIEVVVASNADARSVAAAVRRWFPDAELVGYQEAERPPPSDREFVADLEARLTDRQHTALKKAFLSGYYDANRSVTGDELAASMGVSRATFHQHLRAAERKVFGTIFDV